jgi:hypothetical protein
MATPGSGATSAGGRTTATTYERDTTAVFDWGAFVVGAGLVWVPFLLPANTLGRVGLIVSGLAIMGFALAARASKNERWHWQLLIANVGLWLVAMPALWYDITRVYHFVSGIGGALVILLMLLPLWSVYRHAALLRAKSGHGRRA